MNQLETLLAGVKSNNAAIGGKVAELQTLLRNRDELIADGARLGLKKTVMQAMLFNVKLQLVTGGSEPVPLGDVLPEFPADGSVSVGGLLGAPGKTFDLSKVAE